MNEGLTEYNYRQEQRWNLHQFGEPWFIYPIKLCVVWMKNTGGARYFLLDWWSDQSDDKQLTGVMRGQRQSQGRNSTGWLMARSAKLRRWERIKDLYYFKINCLSFQLSILPFSRRQIIERLLKHLYLTPLQLLREQIIKCCKSWLLWLASALPSTARSIAILSLIYFRSSSRIESLGLSI